MLEEGSVVGDGERLEEEAPFKEQGLVEGNPSGGDLDLDLAGVDGDLTGERFKSIDGLSREDSKLNSVTRNKELNVSKLLGAKQNRYLKKNSILLRDIS